MTLEMSDKLQFVAGFPPLAYAESHDKLKLQFVAGFRHSPTAESHDKLKFVGHF